MKNSAFSPRFIDMILSKENRESLKEVNLTQLAKKMQIPPATFHQWLTGAFPKKIEHWEKIQKHFNCDLNHLISGISPEKNEIPKEGKFIISEDKKKLIVCDFKIRKELNLTCQHHSL